MIHIALDFRSPLSLHQQIKEQITLLILSGLLREGERLPSIRNLAVECNVNPNTVARVYRDLEREGWISSRQGSGSFVESIDPRRMEEARKELISHRAEQLLETARHLHIPIEEILTLIKEIAHE